MRQLLIKNNKYYQLQYHSGYCFLLFRKRQAAAQLIQNYYKQLTDGCGNSDCDNPTCASCPEFCYKSIDRNNLAVQAVTLSRQRARLCDGIPQKYAKLPVQETGNSQAVSSSGEGTSSNGGACSGSSSGASSSGGAKAKQLQSHTATSSSAASPSSKTGTPCLPAPVILEMNKMCCYFVGVCFVLCFE